MLFLGKYKLQKNCRLYQELAFISFGNLLALMLDKWLVHGGTGKSFLIEQIRKNEKIRANYELIRNFKENYVISNGV